MINPDEDPSEREISFEEFSGISRGRSFSSLPNKHLMPHEDLESIINNSLTSLVDIFSHPGWKTLGESPIIPIITLQHETDPFVGIGACPYIQVTRDSLKLARGLEEIIEVHMQTTRTQCISSTRKILMKLATDKYIGKGPENVIILGEATKDL
jgi:hypothetical protein